MIDLAYNPINSQEQLLAFIKKNRPKLQDIFC